METETGWELTHIITSDTNRLRVCGPVRNDKHTWDWVYKDGNQGDRGGLSHPERRW